MVLKLLVQVQKINNYLTKDGDCSFAKNLIEIGINKANNNEIKNCNVNAL